MSVQPIDYLVHFSNILLLVSYSVRNMLWLRWFAVAARQAWKEYVKGRAWRDGPAGVAVSAVRVFDRFLVQAKQWDELASHGRAVEYQRMKEAMLGLDHDPDLAPIDTSEREMLARAPKAVGEVEF